jgi:nucleotide-binding universal stress UspA family protein
VSLLVALSGGAEADVELVTAAKAVAKAAGWSVCGLHVREPGVAAPDDLDGLDVVEIEGDPADEIVRRAQLPDVEVVAVGLRTAPGPGLGHVPETLLRTLTHPLLLVRPGMRSVGAIKRLVVPLEGSPSTSEAMQRADDAFCARGREMIMLHVMTTRVPSESGSMPAPRIVDQEQYEWSSWQEEFTMRFSTCPEGGRHRVVVRVGDPRTVIPEQARELDAELIVLSWRGTWAADRAPVIRALLERSPCPLLLVPAKREEWASQGPA